MDIRKTLLCSGPLLIASLCLLIIAATGYRSRKAYQNPVAYTFAGQSLYVLEKEKNTLIELSYSAPGASMEARGTYEIEPDDADHYYMVRKLYPSPDGIVVHSYIYRRQTGELLGYRFSSYSSPDGPPRMLLTLFLKDPKDYPEVIYEHDSRGNHYFANNCKGLHNIWIVPPSGGIRVENDSVPSAVRLMGTINGPLEQWEDIAVGPDGSVFLSSGASGRIIKYSPRGEKIQEIGTAGFATGELLAPDEVFFERMSATEQPLLTVASKGNRSWVQFDDSGAVRRVIEPLSAGYPYSDTLVGLFHLDSDSERAYGFDLVNKSLVVFGKEFKAAGTYTIAHTRWAMTLGAASIVLLILALFVNRMLIAVCKIRVPFFFKLIALFVPLLLLTARFVGESVNEIMNKEVQTEYLRRSANLARAVLNNLCLEDLEAIQSPADREGPVYERVHETISRTLDRGKVEQTPKWILHKIKEGRYYYGVNIWRGAIFMPCIIPEDRQMFFRALREKTPQHGRFTDEQGEWVSYLAPVQNHDGDVIYALELYRYAEELDRAKGQVSRRVAQIVAATVSVTIVLVMVFSYLFVRPLRQLVRRTERISRGDFEQCGHVRCRDELGDLARAFDKMVIDLKRYMQELARTTAEKESIESELRLARQLQEDMLPQVFPPLPNAWNVAMHAEVEPAREVGGDYYDFFFIDDSHIGVVVADVSGKGIPAGLFMMRIRALLRGNAKGNLNPGETLSLINQLISAENPSLMFVTLFYFICHMSSGRITYCNAGHNPPFWVRKGQATLVGKGCDEGKGLPIGIMEDARYSDGFFELGEEDVLVLYSDGVTESCNVEGEFFGEEKLAGLVAALSALDPKEICEKVLEEVRSHQGTAGQSDDITILAFRQSSLIKLPPVTALPFQPQDR